MFLGGIALNKNYQKFKSSLERLRDCVDFAALPRLHLTRDDCCRAACIPEESFTSKAACTHTAERRLRHEHENASRQYDSYTDSHSSKSFVTGLDSLLSARLSHLKDVLGQCRAEHSAALVNRILPLLTPDAVISDIQSFNDELKARYTLPPVETYYTQISYETFDPSEFEEGLFKLMAKAFTRYGYNLYDAVNRMESDARRAIEDFRNDLNAHVKISINKHIISPIEDKLPLLREALERSAEK